MGSPMNSIPAASKARVTRSRVPPRDGGIPAADSNRLIVAHPTLHIAASSSDEILSNPRAALI